MKDTKRHTSAWYHANRDAELKRRSKRRRFSRHILSEIKLILGCVNCGYDKNSYAMDFHHREPHEKSFEISSHPFKSVIRVLAEIEKCDVMCANCHRVETYKNRRAA